MKKIALFLILLAAGSSITAGAQTQPQSQPQPRSRSWSSRILQQMHDAGWEVGLKAGVNLGGSSPLPLPREIRSIESFNPTLAIQLSGEATKWFGERREWGLTFGLRLDNKNMTTKARVKNYSMEIIGGDGNRLKGNWTGYVRTDVRNDYLNIPVLASWKPAERWVVQLGPYMSVLMNGSFSGDVYDGYLREGDPTGNKIVFSDGAVAGYDFSSELSRLLWGMQAGCEWSAFRHLRLYANVTWGLSDIFRRGFNTITFAMYPIYLNLGFGYDF